MVGLDLSAMDSDLINYTKTLNLLLRPDKIEFVYVQKHLNVPKAVLEEFPDLEDSVESATIEEMVEKTEGFNIVGTDMKYEVLSGDPLTEILEKSHDDDVDLLVVGKKVKSGFSGVVPNKLARKCSSHIILVPEKVKTEIKKILVSVDFSDYSRLALDIAIQIASQCNAEVLCQHIYEVPMGYSKIGKSFEEFADIMKGHAKDDYAEFIEGIETDGVKVSPVFTLNDHDRLGHKIKESAVSESADLVIIGARGRTGMSALLLGSVTEQLISQNLSVPILIVKKKDKTMGIWKALKQL